MTQDSRLPASLVSSSLAGYSSASLWYLLT